MKLRLNPSITEPVVAKPNSASPAIPLAAGVGKLPEEIGRASDGILISSASAALNQLSLDRTAKIDRVATALQSGSYQPSSAATSSAIVAYALSDLN